MVDNCSESKPDRNISLTLTTKYAASWGTWEGVRELVQNWHDGIYESAEAFDIPVGLENKLVFKQLDDHGCHFKAYIQTQDEKELKLGTLTYDKLENRLTMINSCTVLQKRILLLGYSAKSHKREVIGQFGEGLKVGALALVRDGYSVTMETNKDKWKFELLHNKEFEEKVLTIIVSDRIYEEEFDSENFIQERLCDEELMGTDTRTRIWGLAWEDWKKFLPRFLFLKPPIEYVNTELGTLLLDPSLSGQMYVKGLWVSDLRDEDLSAGVSFSCLQLDRDRNAVPKPSEIDHLMSGIWIKSLERKPDLLERYFKLLQNDKYRDVRHASQYSTENMAYLISQQFISEYGNDAFPVLNTTRYDSIHSVRTELQKTAVLCNQTLLDILIKSGAYTSLQDALMEHRVNQRHPIPYYSLSDDARGAIQGVTELIQMVDPTFSSDLIDIIRTDVTEKCWFESDRVVIPFWMLEIEEVHKTRWLCKGQQQCFCREVYICQNILSLNKIKAPCNKPDTELINLDQSSSTYNPIIHVVHALMNRTLASECSSNQYCDRYKENDTPDSKFIDSETSDGHFSPDYKHTEDHLKLSQAMSLENGLKSPFKDLSIENVINRENKYLEQITKLQNELEEEKMNYKKTLTQLQMDLKAVEKQLLTKEIDIVNEEVSLRVDYEKQLKIIQDKAAKSVRELQKNVEQKDESLIHLRQELQHKDNMIKDQSSQIQKLSISSERKSETLLEELSHYIQQHRNRTESLSKVCAMKSTSDDIDSENRDKWRFLSELCDSMLQDLQREKFICAVCKLQRKSHILLPCGHYCYCEDCANQMLSTNKCPICTRNIEKCQKVYE